MAKSLHDSIWDIITEDPGYNWPCVQLDPFKPTRAAKCFVAIDKQTRAQLFNSRTGKPVYAFNKGEFKNFNITDRSMTRAYKEDEYEIVKAYAVM